MKSNKKRRIYLCDLTHVNGPVISSNVFPLGVGLIGAHILKCTHPGEVEVELFKYPEDLSQALSCSNLPDIVGFSNYSWNYELSLAYARYIKSISKDIVVVFGGPNYGLTDAEIASFWKSSAGAVDFNVILEGEVAFQALVSVLIECEMSISRAKSCKDRLLNLHYLADTGEVVKSRIGDRIDLDSIPSPYLDTNLMEKFFDGKLIPLTHSTRGCPFKCTFCSEGSDYYNKVKQRHDRILEEYIYIAERSTRAGVYDLMLSDANYGMFKDDAIRADLLARVQQQFGYPRNVYVSTGKNQKDRVLSTVKKLGGAIQLSASLQSTNENVLKKIERSNISIEVLSEAAHEASENEVVSYTELILGLPGETLDSHLKSISDVVRAGFVNVRIYQLILLPQTQLNSEQSKQEFGLITKFRPMPRSYGLYTFGDETILLSEYEEIVVSTNTLSEDEYYSCRRCGLLLDVIHNGYIFTEYQAFCRENSIAWAEYVERILQRCVSRELPDQILGLLDSFALTTKRRLFDCKDELKCALKAAHAKGDSFDYTNNEFASYKVSFLIENIDAFVSFVSESFAQFAAEKSRNVSTSLLTALGTHVAKSRCGLFSTHIPRTYMVNLKVDEANMFMRCIGVKESPCFSITGRSVMLQVTLEQTEQQKLEIASLVQLYGSGREGLSRIFMRSPILAKFYPVPVVAALDLANA